MYGGFFEGRGLGGNGRELSEGFDAGQKLVVDLVRTGAVTGLRIDHPDGLYLPKEYLEALQRRCAKTLGIPLPKDGRAVYMIAEKILNGAEKLRADWPLHGTTGYDFANQVAGVFGDASAEADMTRTFHRFIGHTMHFGHLVYAKKRLGMRLALDIGFDALCNMLAR